MKIIISKELQNFLLLKFGESNREVDFSNITEQIMKDAKMKNEIADIVEKITIETNPNIMFKSFINVLLNNLRS